MDKVKYYDVDLVNGDGFSITEEECVRIYQQENVLFRTKAIVSEKIRHIRTFSFFSNPNSIGYKLPQKMKDWFSWEEPQYHGDTCNMFMVDSVLIGFKEVIINIGNIVSVAPGKRLFDLYQDGRELKEYV